MHFIKRTEVVCVWIRPADRTFGRSVFSLALAGGQRGGAAVPAEPPLFGSEQPTGGGAGSAAETEGDAADGRGAAGQDGGGGQRSNLLTQHIPKRRWFFFSLTELCYWKPRQTVMADL